MAIRCSGRIFLRLVPVATLLLALAACGGAPPSTATPPTSTPTSPLPATAAAAALRVSAQALDTVVQLSWPPLPNAAGYNVYRDGSEVALTTKAISGTTYEDIGLTNGRTYSYVVAAVDKDGKIILRAAEVKATPKSS
jgi:fibronectin type 3 domain-containing protein